MSAKQFPPQPNLKNLKNQAKKLLKTHQAGQADACKRIGKSLPRLSTFSQTEILDAEFSLQDAQLVIAREYGFPSWPKLVAEGTAPQPGGDADFKWAVEIEAEQPGDRLPDGPFTFRESSGITLVEKGDLLGHLLPPTVGQPGKDVFGREIKAPHPINIEVVTNAHIYGEADEDGFIAFYAECEGGIYTVSQIRINGDQTNRRINIGIYSVADEF